MPGQPGGKGEKGFGGRDGPKGFPGHPGRPGITEEQFKQLDFNLNKVFSCAKGGAFGGIDF